ncbi:hypothetical protein BB560_003976, partial [Smittium megazygosporum]
MFFAATRSSPLQKSFSYFGKTIVASNPTNAMFPRVYGTQKDVAAKALKSRPISPHLSIYSFPMAMNMSAVNRNGALITTFSAMGFCIAAGVLPMFGIPFDSATVANFAASLPVSVYYGVKIFYSSIFSYHAVSGIRYLVWFTGRFLDMKSVTITGYITLGF